MNIRSTLLLLFAVLCSAVYVQAEAGSPVQRQTFLYAVKDTDSLYLDRYELPSAGLSAPKPCMIYVFGGGFTHGERQSESYMPYFDYLLQKGYVVVSIDYRLGLNRAKTVKNLDGKKFISIFSEAISMAVEDLYDATKYVLNYAGDWNIDKDMIALTGSSAGAITVLHAQYAISNNAGIATGLPDGFSYAGIISLAGAVFTQTGGLQWADKPAPILMFHGDADPNVPYNKVRLLQLGFYGSKYIAGQLSKLRSPYYFYDVENAGHEMATQPLTYNLNEIDTFLDKLVKEKQPLIIHQKVQQLDKPLMEKSFSIKDYIKANMK